MASSSNTNNNNNDDVEKMGGLALPKDTMSASARSSLLSLFRTLALKHDELGMEIVFNLILRNLCAAKLFDHADQLIANTEIQTPYRSTNQAARFFYYQALVQAHRLDYSGAHKSLMHALRKCPERALGFRVAAQKLDLVVQLLIGEIPPRSDFLQSGMKEALKVYLQLTTCVRFGNLGRFQSIAQKHQATFEHDCTYSLILRVRQNVLKMGLRRICQAYSRIAIGDVCVKLALDNPEDGEYVVAKAIKDGVIDATVDHESGTIHTAATTDVYATTEPLHAFQKRTLFCNAAHDEARRSMRYASVLDADEEDGQEAKRKKLEATREALERAAEDDDGGDIDFGEGI